MTIPPSALRVLIVDDNKVVRRGLRMRLQHAPGITVVGEAGSGRDALSVAAAERADVVLVDLHMAGMNGSRRPEPSSPVQTRTEGDPDHQ